MKTAVQLERYFKGVANHGRIEILLLVNKTSGLTLGQISENLNKNIKTISEHTRRLVQAGLLNKKYKAQEVEHRLSPYGEKFIKFIKLF